MHAVLLAGEAVALWTGMAVAVGWVRPSGFTTLIPLPAYPIFIALGVLIVMGTINRDNVNLLDPGWTDAMHLAFRQTLGVAGAVLALAVGMKDPGLSRLFIAAYFPVLAVCFVFLNRWQPGWLTRLLFGGAARLPTLILGEAALFPELALWLKSREKFGLRLAGRVTYAGAVPPLAELPVVGDFADLKSAIEQTGARQVLMISLPHTPADAEHLARTCASCGCRLLIHNNLTLQLSYPLRVLMQDGYSFLAFQDEPLEDPLNRGLKRALDIAVSLPVVLFLLPPMIALVWFMQRRQAPGPVFFFQERSGRGGRIFRILKFRSMRWSPVADDRQTSAGDPRVFAFGRLMRRMSIDEVPQFINVLMGEMSVVGPRPHYVRHDDMFAESVNEYRVRFFVKPGITGLAQAHGFRGEIHTAEAIHQRLQLDLLYIHTWSVWLDLAIIARTARQVVIPPPAAR
ncbi:MAG: UDP-glucose:undecaprenyl-phosphate glucose-phosphate transferase [Verrucomicrobiota bacterium]